MSDWHRVHSSSRHLHIRASLVAQRHAIVPPTQRIPSIHPPTIHSLRAFACLLACLPAWALPACLRCIILDTTTLRPPAPNTDTRTPLSPPRSFLLTPPKKATPSLQHSCSIIILTLRASPTRTTTHHLHQTFSARRPRDRPGRLLKSAKPKSLQRRGSTHIGPLLITTSKNVRPRTARSQ